MSNDQKGYLMSTSVLHTDMHMSLPYTGTYMCVYMVNIDHIDIQNGIIIQTWCGTPLIPTLKVRQENTYHTIIPKVMLKRWGKVTRQDKKYLKYEKNQIQLQNHLCS